ncbi:MAG: hypothetical protein JWR01_1568 [Subtercola sp.]|nr:hypothetical protein [Subtercola sp.]
MQLISAEALLVAKDPHRFRATHTAVTFGAVEVVDIRSSAYMAQRSRTLLRTMPSDSVTVFLVVAGGIRTRQDGRATFSPAGTATILRTNAPYDYAASDDSRVHAITIPKSKFGILGRRGVSGVTATTFHRPVLFEALSAFLLPHLAPDSASERNAEVVEALLVAVVDGLIVTPRREPDARRMLARQLRSEAYRLISEQIANPGLNATILAGDLGVSTRNLQRLFAEEDTSVSLHIRTTRLEAIASRLRTAQEGSSLDAIVQSVGFRSRDVAGRAFRDRFGQSLSEYLAFHAAASVTPSGPGVPQAAPCRAGQQIVG